MSGLSGDIRKIAHELPVSIELLLSSGAITEEQAREMGWTPPPPPARLRHWRWVARSWWYEHRPTVHLGPCNHDGCS